MNFKTRIEGTFELEKVMLMEVISSVPNKQEMAYLSQGQQPVVVMMQSNFC